MEKHDDDHSDTRYLGFIGIPFLLVIAPICGYLIGNWLDKFFNTSPYLSFLFLLLGIIAAIREFYKLVKNFGSDDKPNP
jgi:ATP synthase protein I